MSQPQKIPLQLPPSYREAMKQTVVPEQKPVPLPMRDGGLIVPGDATRTCIFGVPVPPTMSTAAGPYGPSNHRHSSDDWGVHADKHELRAALRDLQLGGGLGPASPGDAGASGRLASFPPPHAHPQPNQHTHLRAHSYLHPYPYAQAHHPASCSSLQIAARASSPASNSFSSYAPAPRSFSPALRSRSSSSFSFSPPTRMSYSPASIHNTARPSIDYSARPSIDYGVPSDTPNDPFSMPRGGSTADLLYSPSSLFLGVPHSDSPTSMQSSAWAAEENLHFYSLSASNAVLAATAYDKPPVSPARHSYPQPPGGPGPALPPGAQLPARDYSQFATKEAAQRAGARPVSVYPSNWEFPMQSQGQGPGEREPLNGRASTPAVTSPNSAFPASCVSSSRPRENSSSSLQLAPASTAGRVRRFSSSTLSPPYPATPSSTYVGASPPVGVGLAVLPPLPRSGGGGPPDHFDDRRSSRPAMPHRSSTSSGGGSGSGTMDCFPELNRVPQRPRIPGGKTAQAQRRRPARFAAIALSGSDRIRGIGLPTEVRAIVSHRLMRGARSGVKDFCEVFPGVVEWKVDGSPWQDAGEGLRARRLVNGILTTLCAAGWHLVTAANLSRKDKEKDMLVFREGPPLERTFFSIGFADVDRVTLIDSPSDAVRFEFLTAVKGWPQGLQDFGERERGCLEAKLAGTPWSGTATDVTCLSRCMLLQLLGGLEAHGFELVASVNLNKTRKSDYSIDVDSWIFASRV